jgi:hypothetical protein
MALVLPVLFLGSCNIASLSIVSQHRRSFVFEVLVKELSIRSIIIRWRYPFPWHNAWQGYTYASGAVDPAGSCAAGELLAQVRGKVVAVLGEEVVRGALKFEGGLALLAIAGESGRDTYFMYYRIQLLWRPEREAVQYCCSECSSRWF